MDLTSAPLLLNVSSAGCPVISSTGMGTISEIDRAMTILDSGCNQEIAIMHCISEYPAKYENLNLGFINKLKSIYDVPVGFSDHSIGIVSSIVAVSLGASLIEKHFTLDRKSKGPDHAFALEPSDFKSLVESIRNAEISMISKKRKISDGEEINRKKYRRSIVAKVKIEAGTTISSDMVVFQRPGTGISTYDFNKIIGAKPCETVLEGEVLTWELFKENNN